MSEKKPTVLVTGASGKLGRRAVELLLENYDGTIVATTRSPEKLADLSQRGVVVRQADFDDSASLAKAFEGVDRLLLVSTDVVDKPGHRSQQHINAVQAAEKAGVRHIVYTSLMNPGPDSPVFLAPDHRNTEEALVKSSMGWTVLRENIYMDTLLSAIARARQSGTLVNAIGDGKAAYITREDCARASVAALIDSFDGRRTLDITGPGAVSQYEVAEIASKVTGTQIAYTPIPLEALIDGMAASGLPRPLAEGFATFDLAVSQNKFSTVATTVEDLAGRKPISVAEFLSANLKAL